MRFITLSVAALAAGALVLGTGCGKKGGPEASGASTASSPSPESLANGYSTPALTEAKVAKFVESLNDDRNPFDVIFKQGAAIRGLTEMKAKQAEHNAFAQKYGFNDSTQYLDTWGRIVVGQAQISANQVTRNMIESAEASIKETEEQLDKPDLSPETRKSLTDSLDQSRKSLADLQKSSGSSNLNAADLALVTKYKDQINAAVNKRKSS